eukprot:TRINITY_DN22468_c0_g1_i1.p1 TRINITY_DN22468_c0_g1~~TRINITY_DN22468_c0_g1_i1.p1  ORF type:complete len:205 (-),score=27.11 TRINITY_DN22468_c0_g1_i1:254-868(-)
MQRSYSDAGSQASYRSYDRRSGSQASYVSGSGYGDYERGSLRSGGSSRYSEARSKGGGSVRSSARQSTAASQRESRRRSGNSDANALSNTAVTAPPGYSGYIPGVASGNVIGHTFARANKVAAKDLGSYRRGSIPRFEPPPRNEGDIKGYSPGAKIPGYAGFVPGVYAGNLIGTCTPRAAKAEWDPHYHGPRPKMDKLVPGMNN